MLFFSEFLKKDCFSSCSLFFSCRLLVCIVLHCLCHVLCMCCFCHSQLVVLSLRSVTGEIWCGVNCYPDVLPIAVQFAHFVLSFVVYFC